jgi:integrase
MWYSYVVKIKFGKFTLPDYLQKRRLRWYAILEIPKKLRPVFRKPRFVQSLETDSLTVAKRRVLPVVTAWKKEIAQARGEPVDDDEAFWRRALRNAKTEEQRESILEQIEDAAYWIGAINVENIGDSPVRDPEARRFYASATGQLVSFTEHLDDWLSTSCSKAKTQDRQRNDINQFASKFPMIQDVQRSEVRRWITKLMNEDELAPKTVQRKLITLRGYWRYMQSIEVVGEDDEPFDKLDVARQNKHTAPRTARQPFEPSEVVKLLDAAIAKSDDQLADLIRLGMWTGCRIEELCALKVKAVRDGNFSVGDAKTKAGWRDIPIHRELTQSMARLIESSKDGYALSGLTLTKYGARSNGIGKRFSRLKSELGFGQNHVFHSIRKTVVTILENAGIAENIVADIVGHEKKTMTYGLYSGGLSLAVKSEALDKLEY